ncbi:MAG: hypothetical protein ACRDFB_08755 [Rhabdochlamydiaceae bacterium]
MKNRDFMTFLIYGLAGTTPSQAYKLTLDEMSAEMKIFYTSDTRKKKSFEKKPKQYVIDECIHISLPVAQARKVWNKVHATSKIVGTVSTIAGLAIFTIGIWRSIAQRSPLKAVGAIVLTGAAAYFNDRAHKLLVIANKHLFFLNDSEINDKWIDPIVDFRKSVFLSGLQGWKDAQVKLPGGLAEQGIEFFTEKEIKKLWSTWVNSIKETYPTPSSFGKFIVKDELFGPIFKRLSPSNSIRQAIEACNTTKTNLYNEVLLLKNTNEIEDCYSNIGDFFLEQLSCLPTDPEQVKVTMEKKSTNP